MRQIGITYKHVFAVSSVLLLTACAGGRFDTPYASGHYESHATQCVPYARQTSGIQLYGDAYTWWNQVQPPDVTNYNQLNQPPPRYAYGHVPRPGAVLVLAQTDRMTHGHVAVVKNIIGPRVINVTHTNWGSNGKDRRIVYESQRATDVSPANDWSAVRFWNREANNFGFPYAANGFIYNHPPSPVMMAQGQPTAPDFNAVLRSVGATP